MEKRKDNALIDASQFNGGMAQFDSVLNVELPNEQDLIGVHIERLPYEEGRKYVSYEGRWYNVPEWTNYMARIITGSITCFENEPHHTGNIWCTKDNSRAESIRDQGVCDWKQSMQKV